MPRRSRTSPASIIDHHVMEEAKSYCRRFRLRVGDARQVANLLRHIAGVDAYVVHPDGRLDLHPLPVAEHFIGMVDVYDCQWAGDLVFEGDTSRAAGPRNHAADSMLGHFQGPGAGERPEWYGPVLIKQHGSDNLPETIRLANQEWVCQAHTAYLAAREDAEAGGSPVSVNSGDAAPGPAGGRVASRVGD